MRHLREIEQLEREYRQTGMSDGILLDRINHLRRKYELPLMDDNLQEIRLQSNYWEDPEQKLMQHRGSFEPSENRPAWGLTVREFTQLNCDHCHRKFESDGAQGVVGGIMILDVGGGKNEHYHGYEDQHNSCFRKAMKEMEDPKRNPMADFYFGRQAQPREKPYDAPFRRSESSQSDRLDSPLNGELPNLMGYLAHTSRTPRRQAEKCVVCGATTREGKPYCSDHIEHALYIQDLMGRDDIIEQELRLVAEQGGKKAISLNSPVMLQIIRVLMIEDGLTVLRLAWDADVPAKILSIYLTKLVQWGMVEMIPEGRNVIVFLNSTTPRPESAMTTKQLAADLGKTRLQLQRDVERGAPSLLVSNKRYFNKKHYLEWKESRTPPPSMVTTVQLAKMTGEREGNIQNYYSKQGLPSVMIAGVRYFDPQEFKNWKEKVTAPAGLLTTPQLYAATGDHPNVIKRYMKKGAPYQQYKNKFYFDLEQYLAWKKKTTPPKSMLTLTQLAKHFGEAVTTIRLAKKQGFPSTLIRGKQYFDSQAYSAWKEDRATKSKEGVGRKAYVTKQEKAQALKQTLIEATGRPMMVKKELAKELKVSTSSIDYWMGRGLRPDHTHGANIFFDPDNVRQWYTEFKRKDAAERSQRHTRVDWNIVARDIETTGLQQVADKHKINRATIMPRLRELGLFTSPGHQPISNRTHTLQQAAKILKIKLPRVQRWINTMGAPCDRVKPNHTARTRVLVDPEELRTWYESIVQKNRMPLVKRKHLKKRYKY